jgi:hypothetical protein
MPGLSTRAPSLALAGLVTLAAALLALAARGIPTPWIFIDELLHSELARGLRDGDGYSVRGHGVTVSYLYPALLAPFAWSYGAMKTVNAVVIALTAVPVFLWARRLVSEWTALGAAALTLLLPSMLFSSTLMLENLFLPLFVTACFLCALALERPRPAYQVAALLAIGLASATRVQGLLLVPVFVASAFTVRRWREVTPALFICALVSAGVVVKLASGGLGVYEGHRGAHYSAGALAGWLVRSAGELSLAVGIVPAAALLAVRATTLRERAFVAVAAWTTGALLVLATVAASWQPPGMKERYMLGAFPLLLIAFAVWLERGAPRRRLVAVPAFLAAVLPLGRLFHEPSLLGNAWAVLPFERAGLNAARVLLVVGAVAAVALAVTAPRLAAAGVALFLLVSTGVVYSTIRDRSRAVLASSGLTAKDWLDRAGARDVTFVNTTAYEQETAEGRTFEQWAPVWTTEFWNRSFAGVLTLANALEPAPFFQRTATLDWATGRISAGAAPYALFDRRFRPVGTRVAETPRLALYRVGGELRLASVVEGVHADGTTTGLAAYTCWASCNAALAVRAADPSATVTRGTFEALPGGGGKIATATRGIPAAPFRVEVRARPGSRVIFLNA